VWNRDTANVSRWDAQKAEVFYDECRCFELHEICHPSIFAECQMTCEVSKISAECAFVFKSDSDLAAKINTACLFDLEAKIILLIPFWISSEQNITMEGERSWWLIDKL